MKLKAYNRVARAICIKC